MRPYKNLRTDYFSSGSDVTGCCASVHGHFRHISRVRKVLAGYVCWLLYHKIRLFKIYRSSIIFLPSHIFVGLEYGKVKDAPTHGDIHDIWVRRQYAVHTFGHRHRQAT